MKVGCGFVEKDIHGNRYLYFWCFRPRGTGARKIERYMGPGRDPEARRKTLEAIESYTAEAIGQFEARLARWRRELGRT